MDLSSRLGEAGQVFPQEVVISPHDSKQIQVAIGLSTERKHFLLFNEVLRCFKGSIHITNLNGVFERVF